LLHIMCIYIYIYIYIHTHLCAFLYVDCPYARSSCTAQLPRGGVQTPRPRAGHSMRPQQVSLHVQFRTPPFTRSISCAARGATDTLRRRAPRSQTGRDGARAGRGQTIERRQNKSQTKPSQAKPSQARPEQTRPEGPDKVEPNQSRQDQTRPDRPTRKQTCAERGRGRDTE